jgi:hypothetical protein
VNRTAVRLIRLSGLTWLLALTLSPCLYAADLHVVADFDGDGHHDRAVLDRRHPEVVRISLSRGGQTAFLYARTPVSAMIARDLDGDRRAELITRGTATDLQVWTRGRRGFRSFRLRDPDAGTLREPHRGSVDDERNSDAPGDLGNGFGAAPLVAVRRPRAPALLVSPARARDVVAAHSDRQISLPAPRPPPAISLG